jgi:TolB protein
MVHRDLDFGDRLTMLGTNAEDLPLVAGVPSAAAYDIFGKMGATYFVQGSLPRPGEFHLALYNVETKTVVNAATFALTKPPLSPEWRLEVHRASDEVERWATGVTGIAATRIAFARGAQIWMVDSDGANAVPVEGTRGGQSPAWHPSTQYLAFSTIPGADAGGISIRDLWAGTTRRITPTVHSGTFMSPAFFPDGSQVAYGFGVDGTDVYAIDFPRGGTPKNLSIGPRRSLNTSPTFSRDGRQIAYVTGRLGPADIYIADVDGSNAHQLTSEGFDREKTYRSNPSWSADGLRIAYQSELNGRYQIVISAPNGSSTQALTSEGENEDPYWAPDSRHLVFSSTRGGSKQLWVLDTQSSRTRQLTHGAEVKNGAWSPPIPRR